MADPRRLSSSLPRPLPAALRAVLVDVLARAVVRRLNDGGLADERADAQLGDLAREPRVSVPRSAR